MFLFKKNQKIGKYTVVFPHKAGSYAETYRVKDEEGKVKFLKLIFMEKLKVFQYDNNGEVIEEEVAKLLKNENLCNYVDSEKLEYGGHQLLYIVTEYVKGENLDQHLYRNGLPSLMEIKQIMNGLLSALDYLHTLERPIIHNEVTIENIFLDIVGNLNKLKLIDFGASKFADLKSRQESWHEQDLYYVASERLMGEGSVKSDLFSAGVVLYKLIFGIMPWETELAGKTLVEKMQAVLKKRNEPLAIPNIQAVEMDNNLLKIMLKALAPEPDQRFESARQFLDAINGKIEISSAPISMTKINKQEDSN